MNVFVIMPFADPFNSYYNLIIKPLLENNGHSCKRADEIYGINRILKDVVQGILGADIIIAEMTGGNKNVNYEVGVAHTFKKPCILLAQSKEDIPTDFQDFRTIFYNTTQVDLQDNLHASIINTINAIDINEPMYYFGLKNYTYTTTEISCGRSKQDYKGFLNQAKKEIFIFGLTDNGNLAYGDTFLHLMQRGVDVNFLLLCDQQTMAPMTDWYVGKKDSVVNCKHHLLEVQNVLRTFCTENDFRNGYDMGKLHIKKSNTILSYSIVAIDPFEPTGLMRVQIYTYDETTTSCPYIVFNNSTLTSWYHHFAKNIDKLWGDSAEIKLEDFDFYD